MLEEGQALTIPWPHAGCKRTDELRKVNDGSYMIRGACYFGTVSCFVQMEQYKMLRNGPYERSKTTL